MVVLRLIHILSGIFWVGTTFFLVGFLACGRAEWTGGRPVRAAPHVAETLPGRYVRCGGTDDPVGPRAVWSGLRRIPTRVGDLGARAGPGAGRPGRDPRGCGRRCPAAAHGRPARSPRQ